jgi:hypothetical protein
LASANRPFSAKRPLGLVVLGSGCGLEAARPEGWLLRRKRVDHVSAPNLFGFGGLQLAVGNLPQQLELLGIQLAQIARLLVENQRAVADAANLFDEVADLLEHLAQFPVATLDQHHFEPGIIALTDLANACR